MLTRVRRCLRDQRHLLLYLLTVERPLLPTHVSVVINVGYTLICTNELLCVSRYIRSFLFLVDYSVVCSNASPIVIQSFICPLHRHVYKCYLAVFNCVARYWFCAFFATILIADYYALHVYGVICRRIVSSTSCPYRPHDGMTFMIHHGVVSLIATRHNSVNKVTSQTYSVCSWTQSVMATITWLK